MQQSLFPFSRPQTIGEVLDAGFVLFKRSFVACLLLSLMGLVIGQIPRAYELVSGSGPPEPFELPPAGLLATMILAGLGTAVIYAAIVLRQYSVAVDRPLGVAEVVRRAALRLPGLIVIALVIVVPLMPFAFVVGWFTGIDAIAAAIGSGTIAVLFFTWWLVALSFAGTLLLIEGDSIRGALRRSLSLTTGHWWRSFAVLSVAGVLLLVLWVIAVVLTGVSVSLLARDVVLVTLVPGVVMVLVLAPAILLMYSIHLALYADLKVRREGVDLADRIERLGVSAPT